MSGPNGELQKRRFPRLKCFITVSLRASKSDLFLMGTLSTISLGGCGIEAGNPVEIGVRVEVALFENDNISVIGDVVNLRVLVDKPGFGLGVEFTDTNERKAEFVYSVEKRTQVDDQEYWHLAQRLGTEKENS
jgi:hypothetical protein